MVASPNTFIVSVSVTPTDCHFLPITDFAANYFPLTGRTARIGNEGIATSFYNERNVDLAEDLVKILVECKQAVPDFLESYRPEGDVLEFDDDSDKSFFDGASDAGSGAGSGAGFDADSDSNSGEAEESDKVAHSDAGSSNDGPAIEEQSVRKEAVGEFTPKKTDDSRHTKETSKRGLSQSISKPKTKDGPGDSDWAPAPFAPKDNDSFWN